MVMHTHENLRTVAPSAVGRAVPGGAGVRPGCAGTEGESTDGNDAGQDDDHPDLLLASHAGSRSVGLTMYPMI